MFRCPNTGYIAQGVADDPTPGKLPGTYQIPSLSDAASASARSVVSEQEPGRLSPGFP